MKKPTMKEVVAKVEMLTRVNNTTYKRGKITADIYKLVKAKMPSYDIEDYQMKILRTYH